jgi:outer membrane protein OmpA-like peptidoglycan-associated protein
MKYFNIKRTFLGLVAIAVFIMSPGCHTMNKTQKGAAIGAGTGGIIGAFIGKTAGNTAMGAIVGGAVGGTAGAFIGRNMDKQADELKQTVPGATVIREGEGIIIKFDSGILFDVGKADLKTDAQTNLKNLAMSLQKNMETNIMIIGHTDNTGTQVQNIDLSVHRAAAVKDFLVSDGIEGRRLTIDGKAETEPIADNTSTAGRAQNRRVEIVILANDKMKKQAKEAGK